LVKWIGHQAVVAAGPRAGGVVYVAAGAGPEAYLHALDAATGAESWRFEIGPPAAPPVVAGGTVYVIAGGELFAIAIPGDEA
jgi:outer membrane protein assembly factor BamB